MGCCLKIRKGWGRQTKSEPARFFSSCTITTALINIHNTIIVGFGACCWLSGYQSHYSYVILFSCTTNLPYWGYGLSIPSGFSRAKYTCNEFCRLGCACIIFEEACTACDILA